MQTAHYKDVREFIQTGDLLSCRPRCTIWNPLSWWTWLITVFAGGKYGVCHSMMAVWIGDTLYAVQMTSLENRVLQLSLLVKRWPGKIYWSHAVHSNAGQWRKRASEAMLRIIQRSYGFWWLLLLGFSQTMLGCRLMPVNKNDFAKSKWPAVCSQAYSQAVRSTGHDPCRKRADKNTRPCDLIESDDFFVDPVVLI